MFKSKSGLIDSSFDDNKHDVPAKNIHYFQKKPAKCHQFMFTSAEIFSCLWIMEIFSIHVPLSFKLVIIIDKLIVILSFVYLLFHYCHNTEFDISINTIF